MSNGYSEEQLQEYRDDALALGGTPPAILYDANDEELETPISPHVYLVYEEGTSPITLPVPTRLEEAQHLHKWFNCPTPVPTPEAQTETYVATEAVAQQFPNMQWGTPQAVRDTRRDFELRLMAVVDGKAYPRAEAPTPNCSRDVLLTATTEGYVFEECNSPVEDHRSKRRSVTSTAAPRDDSVVEQQRSKRRRVTSTAAPCDDSD